MLDLKKAQNVAEKAVLTAGNFLKDFQQDVLVEKQKDSVDIQTDADLKSEKICIDIIQGSFPNHNILSKEIGLIDNQSPYTWVINPLDGTKEYFRGLTTYSTLISLETKKELLVGACYVPSTQELYFASKGNKAFILCHPPSHKLPQKQFQKSWKTLGKITRKTYRLRPTWYDTWFTCQIAAGGFDGYFILHQYDPKWYDISAGLIIAQEAGAKVTNRLANQSS